MGLREEIREELEEKEKGGLTTVQPNNSDDKELHGIGWNILHKKFVEED